MRVAGRSAARSGRRPAAAVVGGARERRAAGAGHRDGAVVERRRVQRRGRRPRRGADRRPLRDRRGRAPGALARGRRRGRLVAPAAKAVHPGYDAKAIAARRRSIDLALLRLPAPLPARFAGDAVRRRAARRSARLTLGGYGASVEGEARSTGTFRTRVARRWSSPTARAASWSGRRARPAPAPAIGDSGGPIAQGAAVFAVTTWSRAARAAPAARSRRACCSARSAPGSTARSPAGGARRGGSSAAVHLADAAESTIAAPALDGTLRISGTPWRFGGRPTARHRSMRISALPLSSLALLAPRRPRPSCAARSRATRTGRAARWCGSRTRAASSARAR